MNAWREIGRLAERPQVRAALRPLPRNSPSLPADEQGRLVRAIVVAGVPQACEAAADGSLSNAELFERCLTLKGPYQEGLSRQLLRDRARVALRLGQGATVPHDLQGLLRLWDEAVRGDPRLYEDGPARLRTPDDHTPFGHGPMLFDDGPVRPGLETIPAEHVPAETDALIDYVNDASIPCELRAFVAHWLMFRIHPFIDGNGRCARLLAASLLAQRHQPVVTLAYVATVLERFEEICRIEEEAGLDGKGLERVVLAHASCLRVAEG